MLEHGIPIVMIIRTWWYSKTRLILSMRGVLGRLKVTEDATKTHKINQTRSCQVKIQA
jgi:hypothetical protein